MENNKKSKKEQTHGIATWKWETQRRNINFNMPNLGQKRNDKFLERGRDTTNFQEWRDKKNYQNYWPTVLRVVTWKVLGIVLQKRLEN